MRFDYAEREVDPLPGEVGPQIIHEPIIPVHFIGPSRTYVLRGLLDTGAALTLLPHSYMEKLGVAPGPRTRLASPGGSIPVELGMLDLELRSGRSVYRWSARVGFVPRADNLALLGHAGFFDHFTARFDSLRRRVTLTPNGTAPAPKHVATGEIS